MSQTVVKLGYVPISRGDFSKLPEGTRFYRDNILQYNGSAFIAKPSEEYNDGNAGTAEEPIYYLTRTPYEVTPDELNEGWEVFASDTAYCDQFFAYTDNPEYMRVYTDAEDKVLWGIKADGDIFFGAGVPSQVKDYLESKISALSLDEYEAMVAFLDGLLNSDTTLKMMLDSMEIRIENKDYYNVTKHYAGQEQQVTEFNEAYWELMPYDAGGMSYEEEDNIVKGGIYNLEGNTTNSFKAKVKQNPKSQSPYVTRTIIVSTLTFDQALEIAKQNGLGDNIKAGQIISFINPENKVERRELQNDGTWEVLKFLNEIEIDNEPTPGSNNLITSGAVADNLGYNIESPEYVRVYTDNKDKILWAIKVDGSIHYGAGIPPQIKDYVDSEIAKATPENYDQVIGFLNGLLGSDTTLKMMLDSMNEQIEGISQRMNYLNIAIDPNRGVLRVAGHMFKLIEYTGDADFDEDIDYTVFVDAVTTIENPEWQKAITDSEDKLLYGKHHDGTEYQPDLSGYTMTINGVTASVNSIVNNLK